MDPSPSSPQSPSKGGIQGQISQLTEAVNAILGQLTNVTLRLDHLEENRSSPKRRVPSTQLQAKSNRVSSNSDHFQERERHHHCRPHVRPLQDDLEDPLLRLTRVEAPSFNGSHQYLNWKASMDQYFDWYPMVEERKVRLAKMRLTKLAKTYWLNVESLRGVRR